MARKSFIVSTLLTEQAKSLLRESGSLKERQAKGLKRAFEKLGPLFIKLGQIISVRSEEFPKELVEEMSTLLDSTHPITYEEIDSLIYSKFGLFADKIFNKFSYEPIASASIAQVHTAELKTDYRSPSSKTIKAGTKLAIKIIKPESKIQISEDLEVLKSLSPLINRLGIAQLISLDSYLLELERSFERELDLRKEAYFQERFGFDFKDDSNIICPQTIWPLSCSHILTMTYIEGYKLNEIDKLTHLDGRALAIYGAQSFLRQVFEFGRYHADLHPSNMLVTPDAKLAYLDFGIVGFLSETERLHLAKLFAALIFKDPKRALSSAKDLGFKIPQEAEKRLEKEIIAHINNSMRADKSLNFAELAKLLLQSFYAHKVKIPDGFGALLKSLATVEGVARQLYPDINILEIARPYIVRKELASRMQEAFSAGIQALLV